MHDLLILCHGCRSFVYPEWYGSTCGDHRADARFLLTALRDGVARTRSTTPEDFRPRLKEASE